MTEQHATVVHHFASDNYAGAHPEVLAAVAAANVGHVPAYGDDPWTARLQDVVRAQLGDQAARSPLVRDGGSRQQVFAGLFLVWRAW